MKKRVTTKDIARVAGVSQASVSAALHGAKGTRLSQATRTHIRSIARELGYRRQSLGYNLTMGRSHSVGAAMYTTDYLTSPYMGEILIGVWDDTNRRGYNLQFLTTRRRAEVHSLYVVDRAMAGAVDGVVILDNVVAEAELTVLVDAGVPFVLIDREPEELAVPSVCADYRSAMAEVIRRLVEKGHRTIAFFGEVPGFYTTKDQTAGYRMGLEAAGLSWRPELMSNYEGAPFDELKEEAARMARDLDCTGFVVQNLEWAGAILEGLQAAGVRVPGQAAVVGFGNERFARWIEPTLTSVHLPLVEVGRMAVRLLFEVLEGRELKEERVRLPANVVEGKSW